MNNFRILDSCDDCKFCIIVDPEYDDVEYHFCNSKNDFIEKPNEEESGLTHKEYMAALAKHDEWKRNHIVEKNGYCDDYLKYVPFKLHKDDR